MKKGLYIMVDNWHTYYKQGQLLELIDERDGMGSFNDGDNHNYRVFPWRVEFIGEI